jgi:hypothetical protein
MTDIVFNKMCEILGNICENDKLHDLEYFNRTHSITSALLSRLNNIKYSTIDQMVYDELNKRRESIPMTVFRRRETLLEAKLECSERSEEDSETESTDSNYVPNYSDSYSE